MTKNVAFLTNLYPTTKMPFFGTFVKNSYDELSKLGWKLSLLSLSEHGTGLSAYIKFYWSAFKSLLQFRGIVYIHYISHSAIPAILARLFNSSLVIVLHYHGSDAFPEKNEHRLKSLVKDLVCKIINYQSSLVLVPSAYFSKKVVTKFQLENVEVSPSGGINTSVFFDEHARSNNSHIEVLFASRMLEEKGCITAAKSAIAIAKTENKARFTFVGNGPKQCEVKEILQPLIDNGTCRLLDSMSQQMLAKQFKQSDFFLFPSSRQGESLGLVVLEAMACGCIPIAYKNGAVPELLGSYAESLTCEITESFEKLILTVLNMEQSQINQIRKTLITIAQNYSATNVATELSDKFLALNADLIK